MALPHKITSKDVAKYAGVSQSTVSMVLNHKTDVSFSEETKNKVLDAAKTLGYQLNKKSELTQEAIFSKLIIIMCPSVSNQYYTMLIESITQSAQKMGYKIFIAFTLRDSVTEKFYIDMYEKTHPAGIIYLYQTSWADLVNQLSKLIPIVFIGDKSDKLDIDTVELNSIKTGRMAAQHLLSLGHRNVAYITTPLLTKEIARNQRLTGVRLRFEEEGLNSEHIIVKSYSPDKAPNFPIDQLEYLTGYHLTKEVLSEKTLVTAFIGTNDMIALGIMDALTEMKYKIPEDFSVCGCDNTPNAALAAISLTTIDHAIELKGTEAVKIIDQKLHSKPHNRKITTRLEYEPIIITRSSTGPRW